MASNMQTYDKSLSIIVPVYGNAASLLELVDELVIVSREAAATHGVGTEVIFVIDGSPDNSQEVLANILPSAPFPSRIIEHARNFGSFAAVRTGLAQGSGDY